MVKMVTNVTKIEGTPSTSADKKLEEVAAALARILVHPRRRTEHEHEGYPLRVYALIRKLYTLAQDRWNDQQQGIRYLSADCSSIDKARLVRVAQYILTHIDEPPTLSELAYEAGISLSKLKQDFKKAFGITVHQFYAREFVKQAQQILLDEARLPIKSVAYKFGYSVTGFIKIFKRESGMTPKQFRQMYM
jgi:AraC-like DNA-binding protein